MTSGQMECRNCRQEAAMSKKNTDKPQVNWANLVEKHPLFQALTPNEMTVMLSDKVSSKHVVGAGEIVLKQGETGNSLFVICEGSVSVALDDAQGKPMELYTLSSGEVFGEMSLFGQNLRAATLVTAEPAKILEISGDSFLELMKSHGEISLYLLAKLSQRLRDTDTMILTRRISGVDTSIDELKSQVDVVTQTTDAKLKAAQTMFEQTSTRANEIIESAGRARSKLTWMASFAGILMAGIAGFSLWNVKDAKQEISETVERASDEADKAEAAAKVADGAATGAVTSSDLVKQIKEQLKSTLVEAKNNAEKMNELRSEFDQSNIEMQYTNNAIIRDRLFKLLNDREFTIDAEKIYRKAIGIDQPEIRSEIINILHHEIIGASLSANSANSENFKQLHKIFREGINDADEKMRPDAKVATYYFLTLLNILANRPNKATEFRTKITELNGAGGNLYDAIFDKAKFNLSEFLEAATILESDEELKQEKQEKVRNLHALIKGTG